MRSLVFAVLNSMLLVAVLVSCGGRAGGLVADRQEPGVAPQTQTEFDVFAKQVTANAWCLVSNNGKLVENDSLFTSRYGMDGTSLLQSQDRENRPTGQPAMWSYSKKVLTLHHEISHFHQEVKAEFVNFTMPEPTGLLATAHVRGGLQGCLKLTDPNEAAKTAIHCACRPEPNQKN